MGQRISGLLAAAVLSSAVPASSQEAGSQTPGLYLWADTSYQSIAVAPVEDFGFQAVVPPGLGLGGSERHDARLDGYGLGVGLGYVFADGQLFPALGSKVRLELAGHYIEASGTSTTESAGATDVNVTAIPLSGTAIGIAGCGGVTCFTRSSLDSDYSAFDVGLRGKSDFGSGAWIFSPSLGLTASGGKLSQDFTQALFANGTPYPVLPPNRMQFDMSSEIDWSDYGVELGGAATYAASEKLSLGLKGSLGIVGRWASVSAASAVYFGTSIPVGSFVSDDDSDVVALANLEANASLQLTPKLTASGFVGLNYDSGAPGLAAPSEGMPAQLRFYPATSYYAGVALKAHF